jgi:hypothetical protein
VYKQQPCNTDIKIRSKLEIFHRLLSLYAVAQDYRQQDQGQAGQQHVIQSVLSLHAAAYTH